MKRKKLTLSEKYDIKCLDQHAGVMYMQKKLIAKSTVHNK